MRLALIVFGTLGLATTGCSLIPVEITGTANGRAEVRSDGCNNTYQDTVNYDLTDDPDYNEYKDEIASGTINWIRLEVTNLVPDAVQPPANCDETGNRAKVIAGQVDIRQASGDPDNSSDPFIEGVSAWQGVNLFVDNSITLFPVEYDNFDELNEVVFGPDSSSFDFRIQGNADEGPVRFDLEVTLEFTARN